MTAPNIPTKRNSGSFQAEQYFLKWKDYELTTYFELSVQLANPINKWVAFSFSDDKALVINMTKNILKSIF